MFLIRFSINNPLITNMLLVMVVIIGVLSWYAMPQEMFPVIETDRVRIQTQFEGAPPEDVERQVTVPIEQAFEDMDDVDYITSTSAEGRSTVTIKLKPGANVDDFMRNARNELDRLTTLPEEAEKPQLTRLATRFPVISIAIYGAMDRPYLYKVADEVGDLIKREVNGVASVGIAGKREWELWVIVDPERLASSKVSIGMIAKALRENLKDLPGGSVKAMEGDILLRGKGSLPDPEHIKKIVVKSSRDGSGQLRLGDVARVEHRLEEAKTLGRFDRRDSVNLTVSKTANASTIDVSRQVRALVKKLRRRLPDKVNAKVFGDMSVYVENRLNTVKSSGLVGLVFVLLSLYVFLNFRVALITAMGIPVSFLVAAAGLFYFGYTINMVSMFAFLIALGMIVDDAIIVNENVYRHMEMGQSPRQAAKAGAREVLWPVVASTLTTIAAFLPMFAISGVMGEFIKVIPVVVTASLLGSLAEAFVVLPSHAAEMLRLSKPKKKRRWLDWERWLQRYLRVLKWSVHNRYVVAACAIGVLIVALAYNATRIPQSLFAHVDIGQFFVNIEAPNTYSLQDSERLAKRLENALYSVLEKKEIDTVLTNVGFSFIDFNRFKVGSRYIQIMVTLTKPKPKGFIERYVTPLVSLKFDEPGVRERSNQQIINLVRTRLQKVPGVERLFVRRPAGGPAGSDLVVGITGQDVKVLRQWANELTAFLRAQTGVYDVRHDIDPGKRELRYTINERGRELKLTQKLISDIVRTGFLGLEVVHVTRDNKRVPVRLIFSDRVRRRGDLSDLQITLDNGKTVFLGDIADIEPDQGLNTIRRRDLRRLATVSAEVDDKIITPGELATLVQQRFKSFKAKYPDYDLVFLGAKKNAKESFAGMKRALVLALAIIYFILVALFRSLLDPLVVMFAIPFGAIGVVVGHVIFDYNMQFLSMVGFIALSGIVVNDSLILVDFAKKLQAQGVDRFEAMIASGKTRIRPILLTSITTFLGVSPLIFFASGQTAFLSPMAVSLGFGLLFATVLILVAVPCFYLIADDLRLLVGINSTQKKPE